ncbi:hypothetical protein M514_26673 [Trichuris suis]|uniref:Uncharacterized protein n=1 Tax=Trichuris suis TaxID=68888 RepID=A0A085MV84_9BILA|nr:hypothetical protein M514_26673 [Trichuris suis]
MAQMVTVGCDADSLGLKQLAEEQQRCQDVAELATNQSLRVQSRPLMAHQRSSLSTFGRAARDLWSLTR